MSAFRGVLPLPHCNNKRLSFVLPVEGLASPLEIQIDEWRGCVHSIQDR